MSLESESVSWPAEGEFVQGPAVPRPALWTRPGLVMFFNLECPSCISRGVPFLKRLHAEFGERATVLAVHTSRGHRLLPLEDVQPQLTRFVQHYARLPFPVQRGVNVSETGVSIGSSVRFVNDRAGLDLAVERIWRKGGPGFTESATLVTVGFAIRP